MAKQYLKVLVFLLLAVAISMGRPKQQRMLPPDFQRQFDVLQRQWQQLQNSMANEGFEFGFFNPMLPGTGSGFGSGGLSSNGFGSGGFGGDQLAPWHLPDSGAGPQGNDDDIVIGGSNGQVTSDTSSNSNNAAIGVSISPKCTKTETTRGNMVFVKERCEHYQRTANGMATYTSEKVISYPRTSDESNGQYRGTVGNRKYGKDAKLSV